MTTASEIPLIPQPQRFSISLSGTSYIMLLIWNAVSACWILNISDNNNVAIASGIPLVTGADLLEQLRYLGFVGSLITQTDGDINAVPTFSNLGAAGRLYWVTE